MSNIQVSAGNIPDEINVIIEIPANSPPVKYELDKDTNTLVVDRFISTPMFYPCNYGFIPNTLSDDGDPADVLVITPYPLIHNCMIKCYPVGVLKMTDESGEDAKILAIPCNKLSTQYSHINNINQVDALLKSQIEHFFTHYKDLEKDKWVKINNWYGVDQAKKEILIAFKNAN